jgi:hypothetical protein
MKMLNCLLVLLLFQTAASAQVEDKIDVKFSGYLKTDFIYDSRATISAREGHFLLYPAPELMDTKGNDINDNSNFNSLAIQSRLKGVVTGPEVLDAKATGVVEGAFFGHSNNDINGFRLRHAFIKLKWQSSSVIIGQYWNPFFIPEVYPGVVSFNSGVPFQPFSRNPQIRFTKFFGNTGVSITAASQRDFASNGPNGPGSQYLRNSSVPILNAQVKHVAKNFVIGAGGNFKVLKPRLATANNYKSDETVSSIAGLAFAKYAQDLFTVKLEGTYGQNMYDLLMLGGYGVSSVDPVTAEEKYANTDVASVWTEFIYGTELQAAIFAGYTTNLGADKDINTNQLYARGSNVDYLYRISPRVQYTFKQIRFALEFEYTTAAYGAPDNKAKVNDSSEISNHRLLFAAYYLF